MVISDSLGAEILAFTYDNDLPWPDSADGGGPGLVLIAPGSGPDHGLPQNWRASTAPGGTPGGTDALSYGGGDLLAYALMNAGAPCRSLFEFEAVKAAYTRDKLVDIPYNPRAFSKTWELLSGVETNLGDVRIELPGTEPTRAPGEGEVRVFVENDSFQPAGGLEVDLLPAGQFAAVGSNSGKAIETKGELRSYLLQVGPSNDKSVEASLTFEHEVVGVIFSSDRLESSDQSVGSSMRDLGGDFSRVRGLDYGSDELLLSDDGRTLNLRLQSGGQQLDQVRVLVAVR